MNRPRRATIASAVRHTSATGKRRALPTGLHIQLGESDHPPAAHHTQTVPSTARYVREPRRTKPRSAAKELPLGSEPGVQAQTRRPVSLDRSDPETVLVLGDQRADRTGQRRLCGSLSRTKKDVAALRISIVCSSSELRR